MSFPSYPDYKDSGVAWLGEVPSHWDVTRLKLVCEVFPSNVDKKSADGEQPVQLCNYTDVYYNDVIAADMPFMAATATDEQIAKFALRAGDTIITKDSETPDDIARSTYVPEDLPGVVCGYHLSMVRPFERACGAFIKRFFDAAATRAYFHVSANGLTRVGLGQYVVDNAPIALPSWDEQAAIVAFLNRETAKIDALVTEQERLIALLKEKRQAVISHAVTKGLAPESPMKDSGVAWLGEIPAHWEVVPLKQLTPDDRAIMYGIVLPGPDVGHGVPIVKGGDVKGNRLSLAQLCYTTPEIEAPFARARLRPDDIVYSIRGSIGDAELVPPELLNANITQDVARISPIPEVSTHWLLHVMRSKPIFVQLEQGSLGAAVRGINIFDLKRARIPLPPRCEQNAMAEYLNTQCDQFAALEQGMVRAITILKERRAALISAAVTGKIDVRGLVAEPPEMELA